MKSGDMGGISNIPATTDKCVKKVHKFRGKKPKSASDTTNRNVIVVLDDVNFINCISTVSNRRLL